MNNNLTLFGKSFTPAQSASSRVIKRQGYRYWVCPSSMSANSVHSCLEMAAPGDANEGIDGSTN